MGFFLSVPKIGRELAPESNQRFYSGGSIRLLWLHRALPSATLDKITYSIVPEILGKCGSLSSFTPIW